MANNYLSYSAMLFDSDDEVLSPEEVAFFEAVLDNQKSEDFDGEPICLEIKKDRSGNQCNVWFNGEESGNIEGVANLVEEFIGRFPARSGLIFHLAWATWCDKPRVDEFAGGAVVVSSSGQRWMSSDEFLHKVREEIESGRLLDKAEREREIPPLSVSKEAHIVWRERDGEWRSKVLVHPPCAEGKLDAESVGAVGAAIVFGGSSGG